MNFVHLNINKLFPKIDELRCITNITNDSIIGISQTKLEEAILSSALEANGYDLVRLDSSKRGGGIACYIKSSIAYSHKDIFCNNIKRSFVDIYLPKSQPILLGISYRPPSKSDFVKHINNVFTETGVLDKQELYLLGDLNINLLLDEKEIFNNKSCPILQKVIQTFASPFLWKN